MPHMLPGAVSKPEVKILGPVVKHVVMASRSNTEIIPVILETDASNYGIGVKLENLCRFDIFDTLYQNAISN